MFARGLARLRQFARRCVDTVRTRVGRWTTPRPRSLATGLATDLVRRRRDLLLENACLRQQIIVLSRGVKRPSFTPWDRGLLVLLASRLRSWAGTILIVQPATVLRWHRQGFRLVWRRQSAPRAQRSPLAAATIDLIKEMDDSTRIPSLVEYLAQIPEYRQARGRRHPLLALLLLVCIAMLCGARSQAAIAAWGAGFGRPWLRRLGFAHERGPSQPTLSRLFRCLPHKTVEAALGRWAEQALRCCPPEAGALEGIAVDGKTLRGSKRQGAEEAHLLAAFSHRLGVVLGQAGVPDKTNEIGAASEFLLTLALEGRIVTADALLTQREVARTIVASGGDYLLVVKANQPMLHTDIAASFAPGADDTGLVGAATTVTQHGDRLEYRTLVASTALVGYSDWPGLRQALRIDRRVIHKLTGRVSRQETAYAVTSCTPARATPAQLLTLWRQHWHIENRLHYVRDVTFDEDRATVRAGHAPQVMAAFRNAAVGLIHALGTTQIAATCRRFMAQPLAPFLALGLPPDLE